MQHYLCHESLHKFTQTSISHFQMRVEGVFYHAQSFKTCVELSIGREGGLKGKQVAYSLWNSLKPQGLLAVPEEGSACWYKCNIITTLRYTIESFQNIKSVPICQNTFLLFLVKRICGLFTAFYHKRRQLMEDTLKIKGKLVTSQRGIPGQDF